MQGTLADILVQAQKSVQEARGFDNPGIKGRGAQFCPEIHGRPVHVDHQLRLGILSSLQQSLRSL